MAGPLDLNAYYTAIQPSDVRPIVQKVGPVEDEVRNFIDGRRSIREIRDAVAAEALFKNVPAPSVLDVEAFVKLLEKFGYVKLSTR